MIRSQITGRFESQITRVTRFQRTDLPTNPASAVAFLQKYDILPKTTENGEVLQLKQFSALSRFGDKLNDNLKLGTANR